MPVDIDEIKRENPIEKVIGEDFELRGHGDELETKEHDSLKIKVNEGYYYWNQRGHGGDVIDWLIYHRGLDFKTAIETLARRAGLPDPDWARGEVQERLAATARADAWTVATNTFKKWLFGYEDAIAYARSRGWTDETIQKSALGYTGPAADRAKLKKELRDELILFGIKENSPAAVVLLGFNGDVEKWAWDHDLTDIVKEKNKKWIEQSWIPGMIGNDSLVYPHIYQTKTIYFSQRGIHEKTHLNIAKTIAGERRIYLNSEWGPQKPRYVIVEGQADAVTLAQWGIPAIALCGTNSIKTIKNLIKKDANIFIGLDNDAAGQQNVKNVVETAWPLARVLHWPEELGNVSIKDANDMLRFWVKEGVEHQKQLDYLTALNANSISYIEELAATVGNTKDASERDSKELECIRLFLKLDETQQTQYQQRVAKAMNRQLRDFNRLIKQMATSGDIQNNDKPAKIISTYGGYYHEWLLDYMYDPETETAALAYKDPDGNIGKAPHVDIWVNGERHRYIPDEAYSFIQQESIIFASDIGEKKSQREIVAILSAFLKKAYLFDDESLPRIIAYYIMMTWIYDAFDALCYLRAIGPAGCGKSELMKRIGWLCYRPTRSNGNDTVATMFHTTELFGGTMVIEEYDQASTETTDGFVKTLNSGAMRGGQTKRMVEFNRADGTKKLRPEGYSVYCPKLLDGRVDTKDDAVGTRCLTFRMMKKTTTELLDADIPFFIDNEFKRKALAIQNLMLRWRLETWKKNIPIFKSDVDQMISPRMNQVTLSMKAIARLSEDDEVTKDLTALLREMNNQEVLSKADTIEARVVEAVWRIFLYPKYHKKYVIDIDGKLCLYPKHVGLVTNSIIDQMNNPDNADKPNKNGASVSSQKIGHILGKEFNLRKKPRTASGYPYEWHEAKMIGMAQSYGVDWQMVLASILKNYEKEEIPVQLFHLAEKRDVDPNDYLVFEKIMDVDIDENVEISEEKPLKKEKSLQKGNQNSLLE